MGISTIPDATVHTWVDPYGVVGRFIFRSPISSREEACRMTCAGYDSECKVQSECQGARRGKQFILHISKWRTMSGLAWLALNSL